MKKISIIVPALNSAKYVNKTLESIKKQRYKNIEVLMIYTESKDDTKQILQRYEASDPRFKFVTNDVHVGVAYSRNLGLQNASGDYITFVDSDDIVSEGIYDALVSLLESENADIAICKETSELKNLQNSSAESPLIMSRHDARKAFLEGKLFYAEVWNKLIRKEIIGNVEFSPQGIADDVLFSWQVISNADKIVYLPSKLYFYRYNPNGISKKNFMIENYTGLQNVYTTIENDVIGSDQELKLALSNRKAVINAQSFLSYSISDVNDAKLLSCIRQDRVRFSDKSKSFKFKERVMARLYNISPSILAAGYKLYSKRRNLIND